jgi:hypothetical protein
MAKSKFYLIVCIIIAVLGCNKKNIIKDRCYYITNQAYEEIRRGNLFGSESSDQSESYLKFKRYGIIDNGWYPVNDSCFRRIMDSVITKKYLRTPNIATSEINEFKKENIVLSNVFVIENVDPYPQYFHSNSTFFEMLVKQLSSLKVEIKDTNLIYSTMFIYTISKEGKLINPIIEKKINSKIDSSIISIIRDIPNNWRPAYKNKKPVNTTFFFFYDFHFPFWCREPTKVPDI